MSIIQSKTSHLHRPSHLHTRHRRGILTALVLTALACENTIDPVGQSADDIAPTVAQVNPGAGTTVGPRTNVSVTFSEPLDPASVTLATFMVSELSAVSSSTRIVGTIRRDTGGRRFEFAPAGGKGLPENAQIEAVVLSGVTDLAGNALANEHRWMFETTSLEPEPGTPHSPLPNNGELDVPVEPVLQWRVVGDIDATFDVRLGEASGVLENVASGLGERRFLAGPLAHETEYRWQVVTHGDDTPLHGEVWVFTTAAAPDTLNQAPGAPSEPEPPDGALGVTPDVTLSWQGGDDPDGDDVTFEVYFGTSDNPPLVAAVAAGAARSYDPPADLALGTRYRWRIIADDGRGGRTDGGRWQFHVGQNAPPEAPGPPSPADGADQIEPSVMLSWGASNDPDGDPVVYDVYLGTDSSPPLVAAGQSATTYDPHLTPGTVYHWKVVADDGNEHPVESPTWSFTTNAAPSEPCNPGPTAGATGVGTGTNLTWACGEDPEDGEVDYDIYFAAGDPDPPLVETVGDRSYDPGPLALDTTYHWKVVARDQLGAEATGPVWSFTTMVDPPNRPPDKACDPDPEHCLAVPPPGPVPNAVILRWRCVDDADGDQVKYDIALGNDADPPYWDTTRFYDPGEEARYPEGGALGLPAEGVWYWRVDAIDEDGEVTRGDTWCFVVAPGGAADSSRATSE